MQMAKRLEAMDIDKYKGLIKKNTKNPVWNGKVREDRDSLIIPYKWRKPRKIFVNSMSDLFHEKVSESFIRDVWKVMEETPQHNYQILTKNPARFPFHPFRLWYVPNTNIVFKTKSFPKGVALMGH